MPIVIETLVLIIVISSIILYSPFAKAIAEALFGKGSVEFNELNKKYEELKVQVNEQQEQINKLTETLLFYDSNLSKLAKEDNIKLDKLKKMNNGLNKDANNI